MNASCEQAYRVYIREVVAETRTSKCRGTRLKMALNISIPLFIQPQTMQKNYVWSAKWCDSQHLQLELHNTGNVTIFTNQWQLLSGHKPFSPKHAVFNYIQPKQSQHWMIKASRVKLPLSVSANINGQLVRAHVQTF